jgi:hypothetical protein
MRNSKNKESEIREQSRKALKIWGKTPKKGLRALKIKKLILLI